MQFIKIITHSYKNLKSNIPHLNTTHPSFKKQIQYMMCRLKV